jgi:hypothetical protein
MMHPGDDNHLSAASQKATDTATITQTHQDKILDRRSYHRHHIVTRMENQLIRQIQVLGTPVLVIKEEKIRGRVFVQSSRIVPNQNAA